MPLHKVVHHLELIESKKALHRLQNSEYLHTLVSAPSHQNQIQLRDPHYHWSPTPATCCKQPKEGLLNRLGQAQNFAPHPPRLITRYHDLVQTQLKIDLEPRSEEHTSELQSRENLVCRLLLEKKKTTKQ